MKKQSSLRLVFYEMPLSYGRRSYLLTSALNYYVEEEQEVEHFVEFLDYRLYPVIDSIPNYSHLKSWRVRSMEKFAIQAGKLSVSHWLIAPIAPRLQQQVMQAMMNEMKVGMENLEGDSSAVNGT